MVPARGIEPRLRALQARVIPLDQSGIKMGCELGFDPNLPASQARVLPLHYKHHKLNSRRWPLSNGHLMGLATYSIAAARRETLQYGGIEGNQTLVLR